MGYRHAPLVDCVARGRRLARTGSLGLGADAAPTGTRAVRDLQNECNRFVPSVFAQPLPVDGLLSYTTAIYAARVLFERAKHANETIPGAETKKLLADATARLAAPMPWVGDHLDQVTSEIRGYGNFLGLPAASGTLTRLVSDWRVWVAAAGVGILVYGRRRRTR